jgi:hypothetical protein
MNTHHREPRRIGRPPRSGEKLQAICLTLPPADIARLETESRELGIDSVSAVVRVAVSGYFRRLSKRRKYEGVTG